IFFGDSDTVAICQLTEDASIEQKLEGGFYCGELFLNIDLPDGVNGKVVGSYRTQFDVYHNEGWTFDGSDTSQTPEIRQPLFYVGTSADIVNIWLRD
ncbi:MAG: hypothetical protein P1Q69_07490, partial [Candidatus Thorarchaeota archaeon]|nr:hypothetical protein [Candidatus Thorarchaeota archaeon]